MNKCWIPVLTVLALLTGCSTVEQGSIPVVDSGSRVSNSERVAAGQKSGGYRQTTTQVRQQAQAVPQDSGVTVMVPGGSTAPIQTYAAPVETAPISANSAPIDTSSTVPPQTIYTAQPPVNTTYNAPPVPVAPSGVPSSSGGGLSADEQLDGPVLALLTTAQTQQNGGDLNGASSSLERAQRVAPREPQVLYRLAQVRLAQGDAAQAEQLARRGLTYANGRASLQASLWELIAQSREKQGDASGAALARQKAKVSL